MSCNHLSWILFLALIDGLVFLRKESAVGHSCDYHYSFWGNTVGRRPSETSTSVRAQGPYKRIASNSCVLHKKGLHLVLLHKVHRFWFYNSFVDHYGAQSWDPLFNRNRYFSLEPWAVIHPFAHLINLLNPLCACPTLHLAASFKALST